jgi:predicted nucleotidyltransferase
MLGWRAELQERWANRTALPLSEAERRFLRAVAETLQRALNAEAVILFGSTARGEATPESDIDLLIVAPISGNFYQRMAAARRALRPLRQGRAITPIVLSPEEFERLVQERNAFIGSVLREGVLIQ